MNIVKPNKLKQGDTIAIVSPSWGGPGTFPAVYQSGIHNIEKYLGLKVKEYPETIANADYLYEHPEVRAEHINRAFADSEVKAIFSSIGGDDSIRILKYLDSNIIQKNPKIFMGYSDTTTLLTFIRQLGIVTFNGPSVMAGFAQMNNLPKTFSEHVKELLFTHNTTYEYRPYEVWCDGYPSWSEKGYRNQLKELHQNTDGWHWLQGETTVEGQLFGGCIEVLEFLKGTKYWPKKDFWKNQILFFETSENKPSIDVVSCMLRNYGIQGIFEQISGVLIGRCRDYSVEEKKEFDEMVVRIIVKEFGQEQIPIVTNLDFGHTDPQFILPLGVRAQIDTTKKALKLTEAAVDE